MPEGKLATEFVAKLLPKDSDTILWGPKDDSEKDQYDRLLAVIFIQTQEGLSDPPIIVQERIIRAGWSPLWEKYGEVSFTWRARLVGAQKEAKEKKVGVWGRLLST